MRAATSSFGHAGPSIGRAPDGNQHLKPSARLTRLQNQAGKQEHLVARGPGVIALFPRPELPNELPISILCHRRAATAPRTSTTVRSNPCRALISRWPSIPIMPPSWPCPDSLVPPHVNLPALPPVTRRTDASINSVPRFSGPGEIFSGPQRHLCAQPRSRDALIQSASTHAATLSPSGRKSVAKTRAFADRAGRSGRASDPRRVPEA